MMLEMIAAFTDAGRPRLRPFPGTGWHGEESAARQAPSNSFPHRHNRGFTL